MRSILPILFFALCSFSGGAQTLYPFPQPGLIQTQVYFGNWTEYGYPHNNSFFYSQDTTVGIYTYAKFDLFDYGTKFYTYYDSGKVYYLPLPMSLSNPFAGELIYDFSLIVGDSINLNSQVHYGYYKVFYTGSLTLLNGQNRKHMKLVKGSDTLEWIDAIGDIKYGITYEADFEGGYEYFVCQSDSTGPVYSKFNSTFECDPYSPLFELGSVTCAPFSFTLAVDSTTCDISCDAQVAITGVSGGTGSLSYSIDGGTTFVSSSTFNFLCPATYELIIMDSFGNSCAVTLFAPIGNEVEFTLTQTDASCDAVCNGSVQLLPISGGSPPYSGSIDGGFFSTLNYPNLCVGSHTFCVMENGWGCTACTTIVINAPIYNVNYTPTITPASCATCCDGDVAIIVNSGGTPPYSLSYTPSVTPNNFCASDYILTIYDSVGCSYSDTINVSYLNAITENRNEDEIILYPNPTNSSITIEFSSLQNSTYTLHVTDVLGKTIYSKSFNVSTGLNKLDVDLGHLADGVFLLQIVSKESVFQTTRIIKQ